MIKSVRKWRHLQGKIRTNDIENERKNRPPNYWLGWDIRVEEEQVIIIIRGNRKFAFELCKSQNFYLKRTLR